MLTLFLLLFVMIACSKQSKIINKPIVLYSAELDNGDEIIAIQQYYDGNNVFNVGEIVYLDANNNLVPKEFGTRKCKIIKQIK